MNTQSLTEIQQEAIDYWMRAKRPNDHRVRRKACRMVRNYCEAHNYPEGQIGALVRDMIDMYDLEKAAE